MARHDLITEPFCAEAQLSSRMVGTAPTEKLLELAIGDDAAGAYRTTRSIRRLLDPQAELDLPLTTRARLAALEELARRYLAERRRPGTRICEPAAAARVFSSLALLDNEELHVALLDAKNVVITVERVGLGGPASVEIHPSQIFRPAILRNAVGIILAHNHPSGDPTPSEADRVLTRRMTVAAQSLGIKLLDHVIVGDSGRFYSFAECGAVGAEGDDRLGR
jgi:DNA repair protein RadC